MLPGTTMSSTFLCALPVKGSMAQPVVTEPLNAPATPVGLSLSDSASVTTVSETVAKNAAKQRKIFLFGIVPPLFALSEASFLLAAAELRGNKFQFCNRRQQISWMYSPSLERED